LEDNNNEEFKNYCDAMGPTFQHCASSGTSDFAPLQGKNQALELGVWDPIGQCHHNLYIYKSTTQGLREIRPYNCPSLGSKAEGSEIERENHK
jgi:hypothetical protein